MADLYICHHMGVGDAIHCNGMVRKLLADKNYDKVYVFVKNHNKNCIDWMYRDNDQIETIGFDITPQKMDGNAVCAKTNKIFSERMKKNDKYLRIGFGEYFNKTNEIGPMSCDMIFYDQIDMPYRNRFDYCYWERDSIEEERVYRGLVPADTKYIFVHDDIERHLTFPIENKFYVVKNDPSEILFNLGTVLEKAEEIHVMESSIRCMMEFHKPQLVANNVKLYLHLIPGRNHRPCYNNRLDAWNGTSLSWEIVG